MQVRKLHIAILSFILVCCLFMQQSVSASNFGSGLYGEDVPFGSATSIAISLSGAVSMSLAPGVGDSDTHTITVTSTDVVGYKLYAKATTTSAMSNGTDTIASSANGSPATLATNSWGYNTTGSTTLFKGMTTSDALLLDTSGPFKNGNDTDITYGALVDMSKSSGVYTVDVTYTAVGEDT